VQVRPKGTQLGDVIDSKKMLALPLTAAATSIFSDCRPALLPHCGDHPAGSSVAGGLKNSAISRSMASANGERLLVNGGDVSEGRNMGAGLVPNLDSIGISADHQQF